MAIENNNKIDLSHSIEYGEKSDRVKKVQSDLIKLGYLEPTYTSTSGEDIGNNDGIFGKGTLNAIKKFQSDNGLIVDGVLGRNTLSILKSKINILNVSGIVGESEESKKLDKKQDEEILKLKQKKHIEEFNAKIDSKFKLRSLSLDTYNDNYIGLDGKEYGDDTGKTFAFKGIAVFEYKGEEYRMKLDLTHFTSGEEFVYNEKGERLWDLTGFENAIRIDYGQVGIDKKVLDEKIKDYYIKAYIGGGISGLGDFGGKYIQDKWHNTIGAYNSDFGYEKMSGGTVYVDGSLDVKKYIAGDKKYGIYYGAGVNAQLSLDNSYGKNEISGSAYVGAEYGSVNVDVNYKKGYTSYSDKSKTIINSGVNGANSSVSVNVGYSPYGKDGITGNIGFENSIDKQNQFNLGIGYKF